MAAAPKPSNEKARMKALQRLEILDSTPERFGDAIVAAAAAVANTPVCAISIIDSERQWFKSSLGLYVPETSRDVSFCAHAILSPQQPLTVWDATTDERFKQNPLVTGSMNIRMYVGFPLVVNEHAIGALCVIDDRARELTEAQLGQLAVLAEGASAWLTLRLATAV